MFRLGHNSINLSQAVNRSAPLNRGLRGWWLIGNNSPRGSRLLDLCEQGNHGAMTGGAWNSAGSRIGGRGSLKVDMNEYVTAAVPAGIHGGTSASIGGWWKKTVSTDTGGDIGAFVSGTASPSSGADLWPYYSEAFYVGMFRQNRVACGSPPSASTNWNHYMVTTDGTTWRIYQNGIEFKNNAAEGTVVLTALVFGKSASAAIYGTGSMDDIRLYDRAIAADEVLALYNASRTGYQNELNRIARPISVAGSGAPAATKFRRMIFNRTGSRGAIC